MDMVTGIGWIWLQVSHGYEYRHTYEQKWQLCYKYCIILDSFIHLLCFSDKIYMNSAFVTDKHLLSFNLKYYISGFLCTCK